MSTRILLLIGSALALATVGAGVAGAGAVHHFGQGPMSKAEHKAHVQEMVGEALDAADATDDQASQVNALFEDAFPRFEALHEGMEAHHAQIRAVLTAPTVDRAAMETVRLDGVARFDEISTVVTDLAGDVADVLTQEQREKLADIADKMRPQ